MSLTKIKNMYFVDTAYISTSKSSCTSPTSISISPLDFTRSDNRTMYVDMDAARMCGVIRSGIARKIR